MCGFCAQLPVLLAFGFGTATAALAFVGLRGGEAVFGALAAPVQPGKV